MLSSVHLRSSRYRICCFGLSSSSFSLSGLDFLGAFKVSLLFLHADSTCQICSAAAVRDQKASQTDAQHHPLVNILHQRDYYMWWVTMASVLLVNSTFKIVCHFSAHMCKGKRRSEKCFIVTILCCDAAACAPATSHSTLNKPLNKWMSYLLVKWSLMSVNVF